MNTNNSIQVLCLYLIGCEKLLVVGQVLSMKIRFNNNGVISKVNHPYIIVEIDNANNLIEVAQIDSLEFKPHKAAFKSNHVIPCTDPNETVIDKDSFVQMDNIFKIDICSEIMACRRQVDKLSEGKLKKLISSYQNYQNNNEIDEVKIVYMDRNEICSLNNISLSA